MNFSLLTIIIDWTIPFVGIDVINEKYDTPNKIQPTHPLNQDGQLVKRQVYHTSE